MGGKITLYCDAGTPQSNMLERCFREEGIKINVIDTCRNIPQVIHGENSYIGLRDIWNRYFAPRGN